MGQASPLMIGVQDELVSAHKEITDQWPGSHSREGLLLFAARCSLRVMVGTHQSKNPHSKSQRHLFALSGQGESPDLKT